MSEKEKTVYRQRGFVTAPVSFADEKGTEGKQYAEYQSKK